MADEFSCNSCGKLTDTGYFYCEKCHRIHKNKDTNKAVADERAGDNEKQLLSQSQEVESKEL